MISLFDLVKSWLAENLDHFSIGTSFDPPNQHSLMCGCDFFMGFINDKEFTVLTSHGLKRIDAANPNFFRDLEKELNEIHKFFVTLET